MKLAEIQARFQAGVLGDDERDRAAILGSIKNSPRADKATLFAVYHDAYRLRLAEFLSNDFPALRAYLGDEAFGQLVEDYVLSAPSRQRNARWYGARLPDFMGETAPWREHRNAVDLARFERALSDAFDAADAPALAIDVLQNTSPSDWPRVAFDFHPSFALLDLAKGTAAIHAATLDEDEAPPAPQDQEEAVIFWRDEDQCFFRAVAEDERLALLEARQGKPFEDICALLAFQLNGGDVTARVAGFLAQWFQDGLIAGISFAK